MRKTFGVCLGVLLILGLFTSQGLAAGKLIFGTPLKMSPLWSLPPLAAEEHGIWKKHGLEVEWVSFQGGSALHRVVAAGKVDVGTTGGLSLIRAVARGVPEVIVGDMQTHEIGFGIWVRADSRIKKPTDLKGAKIGLTRFGGVSHAYGRMLAKSLGLEKDIKFVAMGGVLQELAAFKAQINDGEALSLFEFAPLQVKGQARMLVSFSDYLPKEWADSVIFARRDVLEKSPQTVREVVKGIVEAAGLVLKNRDWAIAKMMSHAKYTEEIANLIHPKLTYGRNGKINPQAVVNMTKFLVDFGILPKEKAPSLGEIYKPGFTP